MMFRMKKKPYSFIEEVSEPRIMTVFEVATHLYNKHGKGMFLYQGKNHPFAYVLPSNQHLNKIDRHLLEEYNPLNQCVISAALDENNIFSAFTTEIYDKSHRYSKLRILVPHGKNLSKNVLS
jgi:hypothetical protein